MLLYCVSFSPKHIGESMDNTERYQKTINMFSWFDHKALFTSTQNPKTFQDSPSHRIFRRMHEVLNINKIKN